MSETECQQGIQKPREDMFIIQYFHMEYENKRQYTYVHYYTVRPIYMKFT